MIVLFDSGKEMCKCQNTAGIYYWKNNINSKGYIGQTLTLYKRIRNYNRMDCKGQRKLFNALKKYGLNNFTCYKVMDCCPSKVALNYWEAYWIKQLDTFGKNGYNLTSGGDASFTVGEETRKKMSAKQTGKKVSLETRKKMSNIMLGNSYGIGHRLSDEHKRKLSIKNSGNKYFLGRTHSIETRNRISAGNKGKPHCKSWIGRTHTPDSLYKMRKARMLFHNTLYKEFFIYDTT